MIKKLLKNKLTTALLLVLFMAFVPMQIMAQKKIAYITYQKTMGLGASAVDNDAIIRMFQADSRFSITVIKDTNASTSATNLTIANTDLSSYDLIILQETFGSASPIFNSSGTASPVGIGLLGVKNINKPCIFNKVYAFTTAKNHILSGAATTTSTVNLAITVSPDNQSNPLFTGINFNGGNSIALFNSSGFGDTGIAGGPKAIDVELGLTLSNPNTLLATVPEISAVTSNSLLVNDIPAGTQIGTSTIDVLQQRMITFGFNYGAMAAGDGTNITADMLKLWKNAALILTGQSLGVKENTLAANSVSVSPNPTSGVLTINCADAVKAITVFDVNGKEVLSASNTTTVNLANQAKGVYMVQVQTENGATTKKVILE